MPGNNFDLILNKLKAKDKILIISGKKSFNKSNAYLLLKNLKYEIYLKKSYLPVIEELAKIIKLIDEIKPNIIIAIGGGSVIDYSKIANLLNIENLNSISKNISIDYNLLKRKSKLVAIPTTAGSGAEVTSTAVLYVNNIKTSIEHRLIKPNNFALIPNLLINSNSKIKSSSAFDVIAQSIESVLSLRSNLKSIGYARKSILMFNKIIQDFINDNNNIDILKKMLIASNYSGKAIDISRTTSPHAISYPITIRYKLPHGYAVSLFFEDFLYYNYINRKKSSINLENRFNLIFKCFSVKNINDLISKIKFIKNNLFDETDINFYRKNVINNLQEIIEEININRLKNNPISIDKNSIKNIIK